MIYIFILISLFINILAAPPEWYMLQDLESTQYQIIGYGEGKSIKSAKANALDDISSQISVKMHSTFKSSIEVNGKSIKSNQSNDLVQTSQATITGTKILKNSFIDSKYYIALSYENLPFIYKLKKKLKDIPKQNEMQNAYIKNTPLVKELNALLGVNLNYKLIRKNGLWYMSYKDIIIPLDDKNFEKLFVSNKNPKIEFNISTPSHTLMDGESYHFNINSKESGYITILSVYEDGTVSTLMENIKVDKNKAFQIPAKDSPYIFEAGLVKEGVDTFDLYIALFTKDKTSYSDYATTNTELITNERYKKFDVIMKILDDNYSTMKITTKHRPTRNGL